MYKLLIEKEMDGFTVVELRNASMYVDYSLVDLDDARKKVYRQISRFVRNDWLESNGTGQQKRYFQTEQFKSQYAKPKLKHHLLGSAPSPDYSVLNHELNQYKCELDIILGEIEGYQSLCTRFPELEPKVVALLNQARSRSAHTLGKVNVLTNVLKVISDRL